MILSGVLSGNIPDIWNEVRPFIVRAIRDNGEQTPESLYKSLLNREMQLWVGLDDGDIVTAGITSVKTYPTGKKVAEINYLSGSRMDEWVHDHARVIEAWAKSIGCDSIRIIGRKGWERVKKDYQHKYTVLTREL